MAKYFRDNDDPRVIHIEGDLTDPEVSMAEVICRRIVTESKALIFDLTKAGYINSIGLGLIAGMVRLSKGAVTLRNTPPHNRRIIMNMGLNKILKME